jgi:enhancing lycopene biosynthesis protein 2
MRKLAKFTKLIKTDFKLKNININKSTRFYSKKVDMSGESVAMLLSGSGYLDGTEITEAVSLLIHLSDQNVTVSFFAPNGNQEETYDHTKKTLEKNEIRNIQAESTRITRAPVLPLNRLKADSFSCLFVPGGMGVGRSFSNFNKINDFEVYYI